MSTTVTSTEIEERIASLENDVLQLKLAARYSRLPRKRWWHELKGKYADNPDFEEAMRLGREFRESQIEIE